MGKESEKRSLQRNTHGSKLVNHGCWLFVAFIKTNQVVQASAMLRLDRLSQQVVAFLPLLY